MDYYYIVISRIGVLHSQKVLAFITYYIQAAAYIGLNLSFHSDFSFAPL